LGIWDWGRGAAAEPEPPGGGGGFPALGSRLSISLAQRQRAPPYRLLRHWLGGRRPGFFCFSFFFAFLKKNIDVYTRLGFIFYSDLSVMAYVAKVTHFDAIDHGVEMSGRRRGEWFA
jgi:hypothetical protein